MIVKPMVLVTGVLVVREMAIAMATEMVVVVVMERKVMVVTMETRRFALVELV
jgi:hypothetical protein